jgi:hypothetical protein
MISILGRLWLNDYSRGALEALAWTHRLLRKVGSLEEARSQIDGALSRMRAGSALEFADQIQGLPED